MKRFFLVMGLACSLFLGIPAQAAETPKAKVGVVVFEGEVNDESVGVAAKEIADFNEAGVDAIVVRINSPGGAVDSGFYLSRVIEESPAPVICVVDGKAASMAEYILQSCDTRIMTRRSVLMIHEPSLMTIFGGNPNEWQAIADMMHALTRSMAEHVAAKMNVSAEFILSKIDGGRQWWLGWKEAKYYKAVDLVVKSVGDVFRAVEDGRDINELAQ